MFYNLQHIWKNCFHMNKTNLEKQLIAEGFLD